MIYYRGTQTPEMSRTVRGAVSFTPCLAAAVIWSAHPGGGWGGRPHFVPGSTVTAVQLDVEPMLVIPELTATPHDLMRLLARGTPEGIQPEEVRKIYNYMHNRLTGRARGGEFEYVATDPDGEQITDDDLPLTLVYPMPFSPISEARDWWEQEGTLEAAANVEADAFIYADAPSVRKVAERLGYRGIAYPDVFEGGDHAARVLLEAPLRSFACVHRGRDLHGSLVDYHETVRPLDGAQVDVLWQRSGAELATELLDIERM